jgi:hypothetical protein
MDRYLVSKRGLFAALKIVGSLARTNLKPLLHSIIGGNVFNMLNFIHLSNLCTSLATF